jgi:hypothetical protein
MQKLGYEKTTFGDPESMVDGIFARFSTTDEAVFDKGISKKVFLTRAAEESDLAHCFGLFNYFKERIITPIERLVRIHLQYNRS